MSIRTPVAHLYVHRLIQPEKIAEQLLDDIETLYSDVSDLRSASLADLWRIVRDLTLALDRWARKLGSITGEQKMDVALEVAWEFVEYRGGADALRDVVVGAIEDRPLGAITGWIARRILTDSNLRRLIRFVIDLAVRELKIFTR